MPDPSDNAPDLLKESPAAYTSHGAESGGDADISLLRHSLSITPWERMLANDDALNFAESLRAAMAKRNAKPQ